MISILKLWNLEFKRIQIYIPVLIVFGTVLAALCNNPHLPGEYKGLPLSVMVGTAAGLQIFLPSLFCQDLLNGTVRNLLSLPMTNGRLFFAFTSYQILCSLLIELPGLYLISQKMSLSSLTSIVFLISITISVQMFWVLVLRSVSGSACGIFFLFPQLILLSPLIAFVPERSDLPYLLAGIGIAYCLFTYRAWLLFCRDRKPWIMLTCYILVHVLIFAGIRFGYYQVRISEYSAALAEAELIHGSLDSKQFPGANVFPEKRNAALWNEAFHRSRRFPLWPKIEWMDKLKELEK